jgi:N-acetylglucosamine-6-sulfatase
MDLTDVDAQQLTASFLNNTFKHVRVIGDGYDLAFAVWCTMDHELYDMKVSNATRLIITARVGEPALTVRGQVDPYQMTNLYGTPGKIAGWSIPKLTARLNGLLLTLKACKGKVCTRPWEKLHPQGNVKNLRQAMHARYDDFYEEQQHLVTFSECALGQILEYEGALEPISYEANGKRAARWEDWT